MTLFYKIVPALLALLSGIAFTGILIYEKGSLLSAVRWAIWLIWAFLLFGILGLAAAKIPSLTTGFAVLTGSSLVLGCLYLALAPPTLNWWKREKLMDVFIGSLSLYFTGLAGYILVYNFLKPENTDPYLLLSGSAIFLLPMLAVKSYDLWLDIPSLKYRTWAYPVHETVPRLVPVDTIRVVMNFTPVPGKNVPFEGYEVEYPANVTLGELFHYFISFHNKHREYRKNPIQFLSESQHPLEWMLYKSGPGEKKVFLDTDKTLTENEVKRNESIYAISTNPSRL